MTRCRQHQISLDCPRFLVKPMPKNVSQTISNVIATGFGVAYLTPIAKATLASAVTAAIYATLFWGDAAINPWLVAAIPITFFVGVGVSARVKTDEDPDPSRVVIDEVAGQLAAFLIFTEITWWTVLAAFLLFRLFDVFKPLGIRRLEAIPNGWGIMLDDLAAGLLAAATINISLFVASLLT